MGRRRLRGGAGMAELTQGFGSALALLGALMTIAGSVGVLRFPDFYTRLHAASITDTLGTALVLVGLAFLGGGFFVTVKLFVVWALMLILSPTASHALANAAFTAHLKPWPGPRARAADGTAADGGEV